MSLGQNRKISTMASDGGTLIGYFALWACAVSNKEATCTYLVFLIESLAFLCLISEAGLHATTDRTLQPGQVICKLVQW